MKDEVREDLWETVVSEHPKVEVKYTDSPYEMKGLFPTAKSKTVTRRYEALALPISREHAFVMSRDEATSYPDTEVLSRIHSMACDFEENNLGCPRLIKK